MIPELFSDGNKNKNKGSLNKRKKTWLLKAYIQNTSFYVFVRIPANQALPF